MYKWVLGGFFALIVVGMIIPMIMSTQDCQRCGKARYEIEHLNELVIKFYSESNEFPENIKEVSLSNAVDPWGHLYRYNYFESGVYNCFLIWSFGSDGKPGGTTEKHEEDIYVSGDNQCLTKRSKTTPKNGAF